MLAWEGSSIPRRIRKSVTRIGVKRAVGEGSAQEAGLGQEDFLEGSTPSQSSGMTKCQEGREKRGRGMRCAGVKEALVPHRKCALLGEPEQKGGGGDRDQGPARAKQRSDCKEFWYPLDSQSGVLTRAQDGNRTRCW